MVTETFPPPAPGQVSWLERPLWRRVTPAALLVLAVMLLSASLHFVNLGSIGDSNAYYTAAVKSMLQSWHNFFFAAAEPGGSVTVDKPPLGLWIEAGFAAVLGVSGFSTSLPNILAGIFGIPLLYRLVKKYLGALAGLVAALVFAVTPVMLGADRNNTMDGMLVFVLLLAAWAFIAAAGSGKLRWMLLGSVIVGLGFNIKMLQAFLPLPAFYALYFFGAKVKWWRKIACLALATFVLLVVSLSWAVVVDLTPASQRPYVGSSTDNTVMELVLGHNGLNRLFGGRWGRWNQPQVAPPSGGGPGQQPGGVQDEPRPFVVAACNGRAVGDACTINHPNGMKTSGFCTVIQAQLACVPQKAPQTQPSPGGQAPAGKNPGYQPGSPSGGTPFANEVGTPSAVRFFILPLANEMSWLLPFALVALVALAFAKRLRLPVENEHKALILWGGWLVTCLVFFSVAEFFHAYYMVMLAPALGGVVGGGVKVLWEKRERAWAGWALALAAAGTVIFQGWLAFQSNDNAWWLVLAAHLVGLGVIGLVIARRVFPRIVLPVVYSMIVAGMLIAPLAWSILTVTSQSPDVHLPGAYRGGQPGVPGQAAGRPPLTSVRLLEFLQANTQDTRYLVAVPSANVGAPFVLATGRPVLYMGGFSGSDPVVDAGDLAEMVANGDLRYLLFTGDRGPNQEIARWLEADCAVVPGFNAGAGAANPTGGTGSPSTGGLRLYQCSGAR